MESHAPPGYGIWREVNEQGLSRRVEEGKKESVPGSLTDRQDIPAVRMWLVIALTVPL